MEKSENVRKLKWDIPQVLRYSALGAGIFYGFTHQRSISAAEKAAAAQREYEHKQELINKAKEAYAKSKQPVSAVSAPSGREFMPDFSFRLICYKHPPDAARVVTTSRDRSQGVGIF